jgi:hypothetical protein
LSAQLALLDKLYLLHKARIIHDANSPQATLPHFLAHRAQPPHQPLPTVIADAPPAPTTAKRAWGRPQVDAKEVLAAAINFVARDLKMDLYIELVDLLRPQVETPPLDLDDSSSEHEDDLF